VIIAIEPPDLVLKFDEKRLALPKGRKQGVSVQRRLLGTKERGDFLKKIP
jgi:hypothetical protein